MPIETTIETAACQLVQPEGSVSALPLVGVAEDAGFEPARACTQPAFQVRWGASTIVCGDSGRLNLRQVEGQRTAANVGN
jgi:hypothetical protein